MIRNGLAWTTRTALVRGGWRLVPLLNRQFGGGRARVRLPDVGVLDLNLEAKEQSQLYWSGLDTRERMIVRWMRSCLEPDSVVIDAGANIGLLTLSASKHLDPHRGKVIAFEPNPVNYEALAKHIGLNHLSNVTAERLGLSSRNDRIRVHGGELPSNWSILSDGPMEFEIDLFRLDDYLVAHSIERLDLIKLDIEGREFAALQGAHETLNRFRPVIIFEMSPFWLRKMGTSPTEVFSFLTSCSYRVHHMTSEPKRLGRDASLDEINRMSDDDWTNLIAIPS